MKKAAEVAKRPPRNANLVNTLSISFVDAPIAEPVPCTVHYLEKIVPRLLGSDLYYDIPWGQFEGGVYEDRIDVHNYRGCGLRKLEFRLQIFLVLEYEFQMYETVMQTWVTTKAYALPSTAQANLS
jgi:hypothetical protein